MPLNLTPGEIELIDFIRALGWGEIKLRIENGQPVTVQEAVKTIRLGNKQDNNKKKSLGESSQKTILISKERQKAKSNNDRPANP
ncbi:hypothetical protein [Desulfolucanica intricata]|uniref:hypothetical protein n=1 Tax=Desulfolucanica intricata TaxID=1285191 RepID=UPI0008324C08|nr:hypothetical protein [Desulfolucanica intricata]